MEICQNLLFRMNPKTKMICLEIGSSDGKFSNLIYEALCFHSESRVYCIDEWNDEESYKKFKSNTLNNEKIIEWRGHPSDVIRLLDDRIDFALINDNTDANLVYEIMKNGGIIAFNNCSNEKFLLEHKDNIKILNNNFWIKVIKPIKFHVYAINWNEEKLLPKFFKHYHQAEKIFILDNMSDDSSREIIKQHKRDIISFNTGGTFDDETHMNLKNSIWRRSKNVDFVIVQDLDEFLFFPEYPNDIISALTFCLSNDITIIKPKGYDMFCSSEFFENILPDQQLFSTLTDGTRQFSDNLYDKYLCFNPSKIENINYAPGAHHANPSGDVNIANFGLLLHYKYIGREYMYERFEKIGNRSSQRNISMGYSFHYLEDPMDRIDRIYNNYIENSIFNIMFKNNIRKISINGRTCVIDTFEECEINDKIANYIKLNSDNTFIDIGCNIGCYVCIAKLCGMKKIFGIEYDENFMKKINNTIFLNGWNDIVISNNFSENLDNFVIKIDTNYLKQFIEILLLAKCVIMKLNYSSIEILQQSIDILNFSKIRLLSNDETYVSLDYIYTELYNGNILEVAFER